MEQPKAHSLMLTKFSIILAAYAVLALWNFWSRGVYALGVNHSIFLLGLLFMLVKGLGLNGRDWRDEKSWLAPAFLIALSYALFENPFLKVVSLLAFPAAIGVFTLLGFKQHAWRIADTIGTVLILPFISLLNLKTAIASQFKFLDCSYALCIRRDSAVFRVVVAIICSIALLGIVVLPLLGQADPIFAARIEWAYVHILTPLYQLLPQSMLQRLALFCIAAPLILSMTLGFTKKMSEQGSSECRALDPILTGIVLLSVLLVYLLFLYVQLERIWIDTLPLDFKTTEQLVKTGFWQLMFLTVLNIVCIVGVLGRTHRFVQRLLAVFCLTSLLLLVSAAQRMYLYVTIYGLSYEKFFASYAVIYCALSFALLIALFFVSKKLNVVKILLLLMLWMYALVCVFPVERFVFTLNVGLALREDSRIKLDELRMFSADIAPLLNMKLTPISISACDELSQAQRDKSFYDCVGGNSAQLWQNWVHKVSNRQQAKEWYEHTVSSILARAPLQKMLR